MNEIRSLILLTFGGGLLLLALRRLRQFKLKERYAVMFFMIGVPFLVLAVWPTPLDWAERTLRIERQTIQLLCVTMVLIVTIFELVTIVSIQDRRLMTLAQEVGKLNLRLSGLEAQRGGAEAGVSATEARRDG